MATHNCSNAVTRYRRRRPAASSGARPKHLTNLVEGLLEISRIESGVLKVRTDVVQLPVLLDHVIDMFRMQAAAKGIELRYEVAGRLPRFVRTDEKRLRQILINLLSNAVKYTREGSATLSIKYRSQVAEVDISDTGIGIAPDDLERIFEPFERGSLPEAVSQPGIGLGPCHHARARADPRRRAHGHQHARARQSLSPQPVPARAVHAAGRCRRVQPGDRL